MSSHPATPAKARRRSRVLDDRALNRALLARQFLLRRHRVHVATLLEHLVGMQAQSPGAPYLGMWSRLQRFSPASLSAMLERREAVRLALMRSTVHLVTARDCLALRPVLQPVLERALFKGSPFGRQIDGIDLWKLIAAGREAVEAQPRTPAELGRVLAERWPDRNPEALSNAIRAFVPLVQLPPRGLWGQSGQPVCTTAECWLGASQELDTRPDALVLRYLAAFGPATIQDVQAWSGLTQLADCFHRISDELVQFRSEDGRELWDLPRAPRPPPDSDAPVRFLPEFDNLLVAHANRRRILRDVDRRRFTAAPQTAPRAFLVDGFVAGDWRVQRQHGTAELSIRAFRPLRGAAKDAVAEEGEQLLEFLAGDAPRRRIRFVTA